nr:hypothetical protein [Actinoplanes cyaneus]
MRDPRARRGIRHQLSVVVTAAVCAVVAGYRFVRCDRGMGGRRARRDGPSPGHRC